MSARVTIDSLHRATQLLVATYHARLANVICYMIYHEAWTDHFLRTLHLPFKIKLVDALYHFEVLYQPYPSPS